VPASPPAPVVPYREPKYRTTEQISRTHKILAYTLLVVGSIVFLVPFYFVVNASLKTDAAVQAGDLGAEVCPHAGHRGGGQDHPARDGLPDAGQLLVR